MTTIKIKTVKIKKQTDTYTIWEIVTEDGEILDTFDEVKEGEEVTGVIEPNKNPNYNKLFKKDKPKATRQFVARDVTWEKRLGALTNAVNLCVAGKIESRQITETALKFYDLINLKA